MRKHPAHAKRSCGAHAKPRIVRRTAVAAALTVALSCTCLAAGVQTVLAADAPQAGGDLPAENTTPKKEVVYGALSAAGAVDGVYVVNVLEPDSPGEVVDFGSYESVTNLTDSTAIALEDDAVKADVEGSSLSYQGNLGAAELPWNVSVTYLLDGQKVEPEDLGGACGALQIDVRTSKNSAVDPTYYDNYLLQISVTLPGEVASNVATDSGQIALAGSDTQVTFMAMPGEDGSFSLTADVDNFSMTGITIAGVPLSIAIDLGDTTSELTGGFEQLADGVNQLSGGASALASGADELASGVGRLSSGAGELASGAGALASGADELASGVAGVASGAEGLSSGLSQYRDGLSAQADQAQGAADQYGSDEELQGALSSALAQYTSAYTAAYELARAQGADPETAAGAASQDASVLAAAGSIQSAVEALATKAGYASAAQSLAGAAAGLGSADDPASIMGGAAALAAGASSLEGGAGQLSSGVGAIASGADELASGGSATASGADELASGADELASGVDSLYVEVQAMPEQVQQRIDEMVASYDKSDYVPVSFTSSKNTDVELVQFVISTAAIDAPADEVQEAPAEEKTIIDRLLDLFR